MPRIAVRWRLEPEQYWHFGTSPALAFMETFDAIMIGTSSLGIAATLAMLWWTS
jgi:hypothetical protein